MAAIAVVVVGSLAVIASGSSSKSTNNPSVPGVTSAPGATAPAKTTPPASGADADVTISKCALADNTFEGPSATLTVTNHSSKQSNYLITVAFESPDGKTQLDTGNASVQNLASGQTASTDAPSLKSELRSQPFTCKVVSVDRVSAVG